MIAIIDYGAGNVQSVRNALQRLGAESILTQDAAELSGADKIIFPGVGEASFAMRQLRVSGLDQLIPTLTQPVLGICLGQQLLCASSEEGNTTCLGIFDVPVKRFPPREKVPHVGWNNCTHVENRLFNELSTADDFYFVHSYYCALSTATIAVCDYLLPFSAALHKNNFYATQFHPEKSGDSGQKILSNFLAL